MSNFCKIIHLPVAADLKKQVAPSCLLPHVLFLNFLINFLDFYDYGGRP